MREENRLEIAEVTGSWRKVLMEKLHDLSSSPNIVMVFTSRRMR
jgi:hypothetical protein